MAMEIAGISNNGYTSYYATSYTKTTKKADCEKDSTSTKESGVTTSTVELKTSTAGMTKTEQIKTGYSNVNDYFKYLQCKYSYMNTGTISMQGVPTTVSVSSAFLQKCMNDPEKAKYLEENLAAIPDCAKSAVNGCRGTLTNLSYKIDANGNISVAISGTNDPDGKIARENAERKAKENREKEEKIKEKRAAKREEEEKLAAKRAENKINVQGDKSVDIGEDSNYAENYTSTLSDEKQKIKDESSVKTQPANPTNQTHLSSKAQKLLDKLSQTYSDMDFLVADFDKGDNAKEVLSHSTKEFSVVFSSAELEKMASDEKYLEEKMQGVAGAVRMSEQINEQFGFESAFGKTANGSSISKIAIFFHDDGTTTFFAELEKSSAKQKERIEKANSIDWGKVNTEEKFTGSRFDFTI